MMFALKLPVFVALVLTTSASGEKQNRGTKDLPDTIPDRNLKVSWYCGFSCFTPAFDKVLSDVIQILVLDIDGPP